METSHFYFHIITAECCSPTSLTPYVNTSHVAQVSFQCPLAEYQYMLCKCAGHCYSILSLKPEKLKRKHLLCKKEVQIEVICAFVDLNVLNSTCMKYVCNWQHYPQHPTLDQTVWLLVAVICVGEGIKFGGVVFMLHKLSKTRVDSLWYRDVGCNCIWLLVLEEFIGSISRKSVSFSIVNVFKWKPFKVLCTSRTTMMCLYSWCVCYTR